MVTASVLEIRSAPPAVDWLVLVGLDHLGRVFHRQAAIRSRESVRIRNLHIHRSTSVWAARLELSQFSLTLLSFPSGPKAHGERRNAFCSTQLLLRISIRIAAEFFFYASGGHRRCRCRRRHRRGWCSQSLDSAVLYFVVNTALIAGAMLVRRTRRFPLVSGGATCPQSASTTSWAVLSRFSMVAFADGINLAVVGIIVPILLVSYFTFRTSMGRLEDANRHVQHINELYLSTIEALAMAVDAKDQITHGHIRRVQVYATQLAQRLGVDDEQQLRAIEAAALLHDMGKLATPNTY